MGKEGMSSINAWEQDFHSVLRGLEVPGNQGLTHEDARERLKKYGSNVIAARARTSRWQIFFKQIINPVVFILALAAGVSFYLQESLEAWAIVAIVVINTLVGFFQEARAEKSIEALADLTSPRGRVLREGRIEAISSEEIVPGDVLILEAGDYVVADARIIRANQLAADEATLTGESLPVDKGTEEVGASAVLAERVNMVFAGTAIARGSGRAVVVATGKETEIGKIARMMEATKIPKTPLQVRLEGVSLKLLYVGLAIVGVVVVMGIWKDKAWQEIIMEALALSISAIPEGLPTIVTLALVMAIRRMSRKEVLIRKMNSVETLGATDIICTDKTGTLTSGNMQVREFFIKGPRVEFLESLVFCNNASLEGKGSGDTTEVALLRFAQSEKIELEGEFSRLMEWSFDSQRKRMSVAIRSEDGVTIHAKGAPESLLPHCRLNGSETEEVLRKASEFSRKGMRVLAVARKEVSEVEVTRLSAAEAETDLRFTGLVALADPPRPETMPAIRKCQAAGVRIIMITGDHPETALSIARELGITDGEGKVLTGKELDLLDEEALGEAAESVSVFARVSPENKLSLVTALKKNKHIVAMTGDGVNDAPALKAATIGVSMGKGGTEVARQASAMVLTDDNFASIVDAVEEGRAVHGNIKRTLQYLLSTNLAELFFILAASLVGWPIPLLPVNILWINLVTDGFPSLALATERIPDDYLRRSRRTSADSFFDENFLREMLLVGFLITVLSLLVYGYALRSADLLTARSYAFNFLVYAVLFRSFACRSDERTVFQLRPNFSQLSSVLVPVIFQLGMQESDVLLEVFRISPLDLRTNLVLLALGILPVTVVELRKLFRQNSSL